MASTIKLAPVPVSGTATAVRGFDWSDTPLGPIADWPASLRFALNICDHSALATSVYWGSPLTLLYNDVLATFFGLDATTALGRSAPEALPELWPIIGAAVAQVMEQGQGTFLREQPLTVTRDGVEQESYWNLSLLPLFGDDGEVAGVLNQSNDVTKTVVAEKRLSFQVLLADRIRGLTEPDEVKTAAAAALGEYLGAARVGFVEVDEAKGTVAVASEWRRDPDGPSLLGQSGALSGLPEQGVAFLRSGQVLALPDVQDFARGSTEPEALFGERLGARAVITVPLVREGALRALLYVHEPVPRAWKRSEAAMARDVAERSWAAVERAESEQRLRDSEDHYRHAVELNPQVSWTSHPDGQLNRVSHRWEEWTGTTGLGDSWANGLHPDDRQRTFEVWGKCVATGEPYDIEHRVKHRDGNYRWARSRAFPRHDAEGNICLWYGATEDIHERRQAEDHQRLLINELNHRVKNTLATVQAIAFQTLKGDIPLQEARARFEARLLALSRAHNLLTERSWDGAPLERIVADSVEHFGHDRVEFEGPPLWLAPRAALALALALHELATNAAKYGALSEQHGKVLISWKIAEDRLRLQWKERGGPPVQEPSGRGFGSRLIERGLAADLGGAARLHFEPDGLCCVVEASLVDIQAREPEDG